MIKMDYNQTFYDGMLEVGEKLRKSLGSGSMRMNKLFELRFLWTPALDEGKAGKSDRRRVSFFSQSQISVFEVF